jgi:hypothetical protein
MEIPKESFYLQSIEKAGRMKITADNCANGQVQWHLMHIDLVSHDNSERLHSSYRDLDLMKVRRFSWWSS